MRLPFTVFSLYVGAFGWEKPLRLSRHETVPFRNVKPACSSNGKRKTCCLPAVLVNDLVQGLLGFEFGKKLKKHRVLIVAQK